MVDFPSVWIENSPESLLDITLRYCIRDPSTFCCYIPTKGEHELQQGLSLPVEICERMLKLSKEELSDDCFNKFICLFKDCSRTRLKNVDVSDTSIEDIALAILTQHKLVELNISGCKKLTAQCLNYVSHTWSSLHSLVVGSSSQVLLEAEVASPHWMYHPHHRMGLFTTTAGEDTNVAQLDVDQDLLELPNLRRLVIHGLTKTNSNVHFNCLLSNTCNLTHLDLSNCESLDDLQCLVFQQNLVSLVLCDVPDVERCFKNIIKLKSLRHLDISQSNELTIYYENPNKVLKIIVDNLEELVSLDISGTNLAGSRTQERDERSSSLEKSGEEENLTDIPGLASRVKRPLEFLGLLNTAYDACYRHHIPAKKISGDATEEQILIAGQMYCSREPMIQKVLNDLFHLFRFSTCRNTKLALDVVMEAMRIHLKVKHIQVSGSASLFYIVKGDDKEHFNIKIRRKIIKILLDAMFSHYSDVTMLRNGCLTLIHFKMPEDAFFDYERLVSLLLLIVAQEEQDDFVQRIGVYLLNSLACQVDGVQKQLVGDRGAITIMLDLIRKRLAENVCDEVMETAWSTMWNVTDETPLNCSRFLEGRGMTLFLGCLQAFPEKPELLRNMMGLLGNVAEVKELRTHLMKDEYLTVFSDLLSNDSDGIEVSYNAAGILSHIASDGPESWASHNIASVKRQAVLQRMVDVIEKWDLEAKRNINYRSFEPILRLLSVNHTPEAQHWAVWALANLTRVYPEKYCLLLKEEGGIELLKGLLENPGYKRIGELAEIIIKQCQKFESSGGEYCESEDSEEILVYI
ncbi:protein zer-1 homolog [Uloborus diversus]|uniref:protein zer-1 homolog n=1 Tax=Uloborus diversus TaxID=327109 RepID=UPI0024094A81|nr:protein zer-1 homolog [Uloborus diversus]